jgi:hypothetical protein
VQPWQYCVVYFAVGFGTAPAIVYCDSHQALHLTFMRPWHEALGILGDAEWELVSIVPDSVAYFKRSALSSRPIDDTARLLS